MMSKVRCPICPKCNEPMLFSFILPYKEYVCVPCAHGEEFLCNKTEVEEEELEKLRKKYKNDLGKRGWETAVNGGGTCNECDDKFNCKICKAFEAAEYTHWGKNLKEKSDGKASV